MSSNDPATKTRRGDTTDAPPRADVPPARIPLGPDPAAGVGPRRTHAKHRSYPSGVIPRFLTGLAVSAVIGLFVVVPLMMGAPILGLVLAGAVMLLILLMPWMRRP